MRAVEVVRASPATFLQDLGRPGYGHVGVGVSGAADRGAHRLANRLVGNDEGEATIEVTFGGLAVTASCGLVVAVTGAPCPVTVDGRAVSLNEAIHVEAGQTLTLGAPLAGLRSHVAVGGGFAVDPVLGSRSYDTLAQLGPAPVTAGRVLPVGPPPTAWAGWASAPVSALTNDPVTVAFLPGPRDAWVDLEALIRTPWQASSRSDRVGVRLEGKPLARAAGFADRELPSEGVARGSIQVPAGGLPVLFLADHPVTGGYPVVGVIVAADLDRIAQARPGQVIRFHRARDPR